MTQQQQNDEGWTEKSASPNQQQEPEPTPSGYYINLDTVCQCGGHQVHAQTCPVCNGARIVSRPPHIPGDVPAWTASGSETYPCGVCSGTGLVWAPSQRLCIKCEGKGCVACNGLGVVRT